MDNEFEKIVLKSLKSYGYLFPTSDDEVESFEKEVDVNAVELPDNLKDPMEILKKGRINSISKKEGKTINMEIANKMKMAARKGEGIPKEILDKMKEDRENTEKDNE